MNPDLGTRNSLQTVVVAAVATAVAYGILWGVATLFHSRGGPLADLAAAERACVQYAYVSEQRDCMVLQVANRTKAGERVVSANCVTCHGSGSGGAPRIGVRHDWAQRTAAGPYRLVLHAVDGYGQMPPQGGRPTLTQEQLRSAVFYMLRRVSASERDRREARIAGFS